MMYNKYNARHSSRYFTPDQFVSAGELRVSSAQGVSGSAQPRPIGNNDTTNQQQSHTKQLMPPPQLTSPQPPRQDLGVQTLTDVKEEDIDLLDSNAQVKDEAVDSKSGNNDQLRPSWMKSKLSGVKKISNKERRRRQNESLRRLLSPKNALMVLNEMLPNDQLANQFRVETVHSNNQYFKTQSFCADLTLDGCIYKGFGDNKLMARNAAAEQAIRDLVIKKMSKLCATEASGGEEDEPLPMIQLASFALYKLFCEWEVAGHKVPQLKPSAASSETEPSAEPEGPSVARPTKKQKTLPEDAALMHPCMLLTYMRPSLEYRELAAQGDRPQNMLYTVGLEVDGSTYIGKAPNKKEARRVAARAACEALFGVEFQNL